MVTLVKYVTTNYIKWTILSMNLVLLYEYIFLSCEKLITRNICETTVH